MIVLVTVLIVDVVNAQSKQSDIAGMWKGSSREGSLQEVTLIIYDDMKGKCSYRKMGMGGTKITSYTVLAEYSDGRYNIIGEKWISHPWGKSFITLEGVIKDDVFSGTGFQLNRVATAKQVQEQRGKHEIQTAIQEKQQQERDKQTIMIYIIGGILGIIYIKLPKERQIAVRRIIGVIIVICLTIVTLGIFRGVSSWKNDR